MQTSQWRLTTHTELNEPLRRDLREDYSNSRNFCDGEIYQQIKAYQKTNDILSEGRWLARLSEGKRKDVKQLHTRKELKCFAEALDRMLPYVGFWPSLQIGTFHRVLNLKCPEVSFITKDIGTILIADRNSQIMSTTSSRIGSIS